MSLEDPARGRILIVCTGNICRSPFIERVLQAELRDTGFEVTSAGTGALVGAEMDPAASAQLEGLNLDPSGHSARQVTPELVGAADLVLTATRKHRGEVAVLHPRALRYAFAFRDFGALATGLEPEDPDAAAEGGSELTRLVHRVAARRGSVPPKRTEEVDIIDPYRQGEAVFRQMVREVMGSLPDVVRALRQ